MKNNVPIVIYRNWLAAFTSLPSDSVGEIMKALAVHVMTGATPELPPHLEIIKNQLITEVDEGLAKYYAKCAKNKQIADEREAKKQEEENVRETNVSRTCGNSKTKTKTKTKTTNSQGELDCGESASSNPTPQRKQIPPKIEWVRAYFVSVGSTEREADKFYDHYEARGWKLKGVLMKDWQAAARNWVRNAENFSNSNLPAPRPTTNEPELTNEQIAMLACMDLQKGVSNGVHNNGYDYGNIFPSIPESV